MAKKAKLEIKQRVQIKNRKASHEYHFIEIFIAGLVLKGSEIKSIRMGKANLQDSYGLFKGEEFFLRDMHISPYEMGTYNNHEAKADRKLLLNKRELKKIKENLKDDGLTVIPTELFISDKGWAKVKIAIAKGKKLFDKRQDLKEKSLKREIKNYL